MDYGLQTTVTKKEFIIQCEALDIKVVVPICKTGKYGRHVQPACFAAITDARARAAKILRKKLKTETNHENRQRMLLAIKDYEDEDLEFFVDEDLHVPFIDEFPQIEPVEETKMIYPKLERQTIQPPIVREVAPIAREVAPVEAAQEPKVKLGRGKYKRPETINWAERCPTFEPLVKEIIHSVLKRGDLSSKHLLRDVRNALARGYVSDIITGMENSGEILYCRKNGVFVYTEGRVKDSSDENK
jgi:hypothetical protein